MKSVFLTIGILVLLALGLFTEELYRYVFCRRSSALFCRLFDSKGHEEGYYQARDAAARQLAQTACEKMTIVNARGQKLMGYYYPCGAGGKQIAMIVHGYRSDHLDTGGLYYEYYKSRGIDFFCCDHTASGESEGAFIGFDVLETPDCLQWIEFLKEKFGEDIRILLHGFSMGAATVLQMSSHCPGNVKFIISDSAYENALASMKHQVGPFYTPLRLINRITAGYDWNDSDVTESLSKATVPILFVHGRDDRLVPFQNGPRLYEQYRGEKDFLFPAHTRHVESMYTSPQAYCARIDEFLNKYMAEERSSAADPGLPV